MRRLLGSIRMHASTIFLWVGLRIAPREVQAVLLKMHQGLLGIPDQVRMGREGGVLMIPWATTKDGHLVSQVLMAEMSATSYSVRERLGEL